MLRIRQTGTCLIVVHRPWVLATLSLLLTASFVHMAVTKGAALSLAERLVLAAGIVITFAMAWLLAGSTHLSIDRTTGVVRWTQRFGLGLRTRHRRLALTEVRRASADTRLLEDGRGYRAQLELRESALPLTVAYFREEQVAPAVEAINRWLQHSGSRS